MYDWNFNTDVNVFGAVFPVPPHPKSDNISLSFEIPNHFISVLMRWDKSTAWLWAGELSQEEGLTLYLQYNGHSIHGIMVFYI